MKTFILLSCVTIFISAIPPPYGGLSEVKVATQEIQHLAHELKSAIKHHAGVHYFPDFTAVSYKEQVVAGINYYVKIRVGYGDYIHAKLHERTWENVKEVLAVQTGKQLWDTIEYFDNQPLLS